MAAIHEAIDREAAENDNEYITEELDTSRKRASFDTRSFEEIKEEVMSLANAIYKADADRLQAITAVSEKHLGKGRKIDATTPEQKGMLELIASDLRDLAKEVGIVMETAEVVEDSEPNQET